MSPANTHSKTTAGMISVALAGMFMTGSAFAMQPLAHAYMVSAGHAGDAAKATEGKCGEGKCGDTSFARTDTSKDGKVSRTEFLAVASERAADFNKIDTSHDGFISESEAHQFLRATYESNGKKVPDGLFSKEVGEGKCGEGKCGSKS